MPRYKVTGTIQFEVALNSSSEEDAMELVDASISINQHGMLMQKNSISIEDESVECDEAEEEEDEPDPDAERDER